MVEFHRNRDTDRIFVGRRREMAELTAALDDALAGQGRLVMLAGEPGIGKTRTAQELASYAEGQGARVFGAGVTKRKEPRLIGRGCRPSAPTFNSATRNNFSQKWAMALLISPRLSRIFTAS